MTYLARLEVAGAFAIIANTAPSAVYHIFNPDVLAEYRYELSPVVQEKDEAYYFDVNNLTSCQILQSTLHEVLRFHGGQTFLRKVMEDHMLDDKYILLKKGSALISPATVQHFDPLVWGANSDTFLDAVRKHDKKCHRRHLRGFGGGHHLCPGRHFAMTEVLGFAALVIMRFDLIPAEGTWTALKTGKISSRGSAVAMPDNDMNITISPRSKAHWKVFLG